jgi:hypothetical protein
MDFPRQPSRGHRPRWVQVVLRVTLVACVLIAGLIVTLIVASPSGSAARFQATFDAQSTCTPWGVISIHNRAYIYQQNEWNSFALQCARVGDAGFTLTRANFDFPDGLPATYPSIYVGCPWGRCNDLQPSAHSDEPPGHGNHHRPHGGNYWPGYLKHRGSAKVFLEKTPAENGVPKHFVGIKFNPAEKRSDANSR